MTNAHIPHLSGNDLEIACRLVLECYTRDALVSVVRLLNLRFEWVVRDRPLPIQVAELFDFASRHGLTGRLLKQLAESPPPEPSKQQFLPLAAKYPVDPNESTRLMSDLVTEAIGAFGEIPALPQAARGVLAPFKHAYQDAAKHIDLLRRYKSLHDCLHTIQLQYREIVRAAADVADDPLEASNLMGYADGLEELLIGDDGAADGLLTGLPNPDAERTWIKILQRVIGQLRDAATTRQVAVAQDAVRRLGGILSRDPIRIHGLILQQFEVLPLPSLIFSLRTVGEQAVVSAQHLAAGQAALEEIHLKLSLLVSEHTAWQNLDNSLRVAVESWYEILKIDRQGSADSPVGPADGGSWHDDDSQTLYAQRLLEDWPDAAEKFAQVCARAPQTRRLDRLKQYAAAIEEAAASRNFGQLFDAFEPFVRMAIQRFFDVDKALLKVTEDLTRIGGPLKSVVEALPT